MSITLRRTSIVPGAAVHFPHSDLLVDEAFAWTAARARLEPPPLFIDPAEKWLARSCFQKSVRRGQVERAVQMALRLHAIDARYVWRAVLTIAVEDVGFGSPEAVLWATHAQTATFRRAVGEIPLLIALTRDIASSLKTRSAVEISFVADTTRSDLFKAFGRMDRSNLLKCMEASDPFETYVALAVLRGTVPQDLRLRDPDKVGIVKACELIHEKLDLRFARACSSALMKPLDEMSVAAFPAFRLGLRVDDLSGVNDTFPESRLIGAYTSESMDQHERSGRAALGQFSEHLLTTYPEFQRLARSAFGRAISDAVFLVEGQCLDFWAARADLQMLRATADEVTLSRHGVFGDLARRLKTVVLSNIPALNDDRERGR